MKKGWRRRFAGYCVLKNMKWIRTDLCDDSILAKMEEHETFTETFTEEGGREFIRDEVQRVLAAGK